MNPLSSTRRQHLARLACIIVFALVCVLTGVCSRSCSFSGDVTVRASDTATAEPFYVTPPPTALPTAAPTAEPTPTAAPDQPVLAYVLNTSSRRFHLPTCSSVSTIKEKNRGDFTGTRQELIDQGYVPCGNCDP